MILNFVLVIFIVRYLKRSLQTAERYPAWDKIFSGILTASIVLLLLGLVIRKTEPIMEWLAYGLLLTLIYILNTRIEFRSARSYLFAIAPYVLVSIFRDAVQLLFPDFYREWDSSFDTAVLFSAIWLIAMLIINRRQQKALEKEKLKTKEEEEQNRIMAGVKAALEVQVAERTAALTRQKEELQAALDILRSTQSQLIQSEKMASLGELTAGIAHEIQNPLNFVNNFSELNKELIDELQHELNTGNKEEALTLSNDIKANQDKINHHGKRAEAIVKGMLQHSRSSNGVKEPTDINALADEYLRLAYHGLRAKDKTFNATMKTNYDENLFSGEQGAGKVSIVPQDIGRVFLNLVTNAFYAVAEKKKLDIPGYEPTVTVTTKKSNGKVEIRITDNGNGVPSKVLDKIFQPFFTTKPAGQGTGLGLSLSYDIIKAHGGEIKVNSKEGEGAEFVIQLAS